MSARQDRTDHGPTPYELLSRSSFGCPRKPISCGHLLVDHAGDGRDENGDPIFVACRVPGCDCDGVS